MSCFELKVINRVCELEQIRGLWDTWTHHPNADLDLFLNVLQTRKGVIRPHVALISRFDNPVALVVCRVERHIFETKIGYLKVFRKSVRSLTLVHEGILGCLDNDCAEFVLRHLLSAMKEHQVDLLSIEEIDTSSPFVAAVKNLVPWVWRVDSHPSTHWKMMMPQEVGFLIKGMKSKHRSRILKKAKELQALHIGRIVYKSIKDFAGVHQICSELEKVAKLTYQRGLGVGFANDQEHLARFQMLAKKNAIRLSMLYAGEKPLAYWIGTVYGKTFHSSFTGYDKAFSDCEVGTLIFIDLLDQLVAEGVTTFDFGLGSAAYKERFGDSCRTEASITVLAPSIGGLALRCAMGFTGAISILLRRIAGRFGAVDLIKRRWRERFVRKEGNE